MDLAHLTRFSAPFRKIEEVGVGWTRCVGCVLWMHRPCIGLRLRKHADDFLQECGIVLVLRHHALQVHGEGCWTKQA